MERELEKLCLGKWRRQLSCRIFVSARDSVTRGFTMMEILIVFAVIAILTGSLLVYLQSSRKKARIVEAQNGISIISAAVQNMYADTKMYPNYLPGLGSAGSVNSYRKTITIDRNKVEGSLDGFPLLFSTIDPDFKLSPEGKVAYSNGNDIYFTDPDDNNSVLPFEIESYDADAGQLVAWVKIPNLNSAENKKIHLYYGDTGLTTSKASPTSVWGNNYKGVWHFSSNPALSLTDSTSVGNNLSSGGSVTGATGKIDGNGQYPGDSNSYLSGVYNKSNVSDFTIEMWFRPSGAQSQRGIFSWAGSSQNGYPWILFQRATPTSVKWYINQNYNLSPSTVINDNAWYHVVLTYNSAEKWKSYINGSLDGTYVCAPPSDCLGTYNGDNLYIGSGWSGRYGGNIDEARLSSTARSADWIKTEYNNESDPMSFYSVSDDPIQSSNSVESGSKDAGLFEADVCPLNAPSCFSRWQGPYINNSSYKEDPWGNAYVIDYVYVGPPFSEVQTVIRSNGPDEVAYSCDDIYKTLSSRKASSFSDEQQNLDKYKNSTTNPDNSECKDAPRAKNVVE